MIQSMYIQYCIFIIKHWIFTYFIPSILKTIQGFLFLTVFSLKLLHFYVERSMYCKWHLSKLQIKVVQFLHYFMPFFCLTFLYRHERRRLEPLFFQRLFPEGHARWVDLFSLFFEYWFLEEDSGAGGNWDCWRVPRILFSMVSRIYLCF